MNYLIFNNISATVFLISGILLILGDIISKFDPKLTGLVNKTIIEREFFSTNTTIVVALYVFIVNILIIESDSNFCLFGEHNSWNNLLLLWLSVFFFLFFLAAFWYYQTIYKIIKFTQFLSLKSLPLLNIYKILPSEYFTFILFLYIFLVNLITASNIVILYLYFEMTNISVYCLLGVCQNSPRAAEAAVRYYFISFISSIFCLWGVSYLYGIMGSPDYRVLIPLLHLNPSLCGPILAAFVLIISGFCLKLGVFPYYSWIPIIYEKLGHFNFLVLSMLIKLGIYFGLLNFVIDLVMKTNFNYSAVLQDLFIIAGVGSTLAGSLLLITRNTVKGFLAANSIISWGVLFLNLATLLQNFTRWEDRMALLTFNLQYIIAYILIFYVSYSIWLNWHLFSYWQQILTHLHYKFNFLNTLGNFSKYQSEPFVSNLLTNSKFFISQINYLTTLYPMFTKYKDITLVVFIWIISGFPPFLLFLLKFYIIYYAWSAGLIYSSVLVWLILSSVAVYGYIRGFSLAAARFRKTS